MQSPTLLSASRKPPPLDFSRVIQPILCEECLHLGQQPCNSGEQAATPTGEARNLGQQPVTGCSHMGY